MDGPSGRRGEGRRKERMKQEGKKEKGWKERGKEEETKMFFDLSTCWEGRGLPDRPD